MALAVWRLIVLALSVNSVAGEGHQFYPNLPAGAYRLNFKGMLSCPLSTNKLIRFNYYLSKKSATSTEIKGNVTTSVPIDDSLHLEFKLAVKDSIGGWKDNAYHHKTANACTELKKFLGNAWTSMLTGLGAPAKCPIPAGTYVAKGADTALIMDSGFPKTFFYGLYKFHFIFTKNNTYYGCFVIIVELKRPWEKD